jgi:hypothetical protein
MALSLVEINAYTLQYIVRKTTDTIFKNSPVFVRLHTKNMERFSGGLQIQRPIIVGELNGGPLAKGAAMNTDFVTTDSALIENMKVYYVNVTLYGFDSMLNDGDLAIFSQVELKFLNASLKMAKLLAVDMYLDGQSAGRTINLDGLAEWYDDGNLYPTVGGINRSDVVPVTSPSTVGGLNAYTQTGITSFTLPLLQNAYGQAWFGPDHVDLLACTQNGWNFIWNALQPLQRYNDVSTTDVAQAGFATLRFNMAEAVIDKYAPTGSGAPAGNTTGGVMYGLNTNYIEWYFSTNKKFQFGFTGFKETNNTIDVAGQFLCGSNMVIPNPRSGFKLIGNIF